MLAANLATTSNPTAGLSFDPSAIFGTLTFSFPVPVPTQSIGACAEDCLNTNAKSVGCGEFGEASFGCLCHAGVAFTNATTTCIQKTCLGADLQETEFIIQQICKIETSSPAQPSTSESISTTRTTKPVGGSARTTEAPGTSTRLASTTDVVTTSSSLSSVLLSSFPLSSSVVPTTDSIADTISVVSASAVAPSSAALGGAQRLHYSALCTLTIMGFMAGAFFVLT